MTVIDGVITLSNDINNIMLRPEHDGATIKSNRNNKHFTFCGCRRQAFRDFVVHENIIITIILRLILFDSTSIEESSHLVADDDVP